MDRLDCDSARRLIHLRLDGELPEADARLLIEHIERCEVCRRLQEELEQVDAFLREGLGAIETPEPAVEATRQQIGQVRRSRSLRMTWLPAAAAVLLVGLGLLLGIHRAQRPQEPVAAPAVVVSGGDAIHVFEPDQKTAQPGRTGTELQERSVAWGLGGEPIALEFSGGAHVSLSDEAVVRIGRESVDLFKGGLRADLTNARDDFAVVTPWGEFSGRGSVFMVHSDANGGSARLSVIAGEVKVARAEREQTLATGETVTLRPDPQRMIAL
ncbi:MAG: zf-HC2 domain-containing protein [Armatimonadota bacterium]|jgi:hypothetical protein